MTVEDVLKGLSSEEIRDVRAIIENFALDSDREITKVWARLPVRDLKAINTKYINGEYFVDFANYMKLIRAYEEPIMRLANNVTLTLEKKTLTAKDENSIYFALKQIFILKKKSEKDRRKFTAGKRFESKDFVITRNSDIYDPEELEARRLHPHYEYTDVDDDNLIKEFPKVMKYLDKPDSKELKAEAIASMKVIYEKARGRAQSARRREFRKAITWNHQHVLRMFEPTLETKYDLHKSRIDRGVIDVYHPEMYTHDWHIKAIIKKLLPELNKAFARSRAPTLDYLDALNEVAEFEKDETVDKIVEQYEKLRAKCQGEGNIFNGQLIIEGEFYKAIFVINPKKAGAPIRLRLIFNVQLIILHELFEKFPEKEEIYRKHTWYDGSEINFIMPEDYEYYYSREQSVCNLLEMTAKSLFFNLLEEHLKIRVQKPDDVIMNVSQCEVCWEEEFIERGSDDPVYSKYPCPGLAQHLANMVHYYHPFTKAYANYKFEVGTNRPSFYCDVPSMNPLVPMLQYKVYPKFRNRAENIMLRTEVSATRFYKEFGKDAADGLPLCRKALSNPDYYRETSERLLQLEMELNGLEGQGYNERFKEPQMSEFVNWISNLAKAAVFRKKAPVYSSEFQAFLDTGKFHRNIPRHYRKRMQELELDRFLHRALNHLRNMEEDEP